MKERLDSLFIWIVKEIFPAPAKQPMENSTASSTLPSTSAFAKPKIPVMKNPTAAKIPSSSPAHTENRTQPVGQHVRIFELIFWNVSILMFSNIFNWVFGCSGFLARCCLADSTNMSFLS